MKTFLRISMFTAAFMVLLGSNGYPQDALAILKKMDEVMFSAKDVSGKQRIVLIDKNGKQEIREGTMMQKGTDKRIFRFTSPASQAGISVLSLPNDVMYLYLPAFGKERRIASSAKNQKFSGTDFSYEDMESTSYSDKYTPTLSSTEADVYVLELAPKSGSVYSKIVVRVNKTNYYPNQMEYYDRGGNKVKVAQYTFSRVGNYWSASEVEMTDLKTNHKTKMQMLDVKYDTGVSDDEFTVRKLKQ